MQDALQSLEGVAGEVERAKQQFGPASGTGALMLVELAARVAIGRVRKVLGQRGAADSAFAAAKQLFESAADPKRAEARAHRDYGLALYLLQRPEEARAALLTAEERGDGSFETSCIGECWFSTAATLAGAVPLLRTAVEMEPGDALAAIKLATALDETGNPDSKTEAAEVYRRGGSLLLESGHREEALKNFRRAEELAPEPRGRLMVTETLRMLNRYEEAIEEAVKVEEGDDNFLLALGTRGAALVSLGRHEEALPVLDQALGIYPDYAFGHGYRGEALRLLGRTEEALQALERAVALEPASASWLSIYAESLRVLSRTDEALVP